jgi:hypothetical protein
MNKRAPEAIRIVERILVDSLPVTFRKEETRERKVGKDVFVYPSPEVIKKLGQTVAERALKTESEEDALACLREMLYLADRLSMAEDNVIKATVLAPHNVYGSNTCFCFGSNALV